MSAFNSQRIRIQQTLVAYAKNYQFPIVFYEADGSPRSISQSGIGAQTPVRTPTLPVLCNEIQSVFEQDPQYRRNDIQTRQQWTFALRLKFDQEVLIERFEEGLLANPIIIDRDVVAGLPLVTLRLVQSEVQHPVQQQGATGTIVEFTFEAEQGRK